MFTLRNPLPVLLALAASAACSDSGPREFLSLGTAGTGGIYYPLGGAMAARLSVMDSVRQYTAEVSGGSVENVNRLRENHPYYARGAIPAGAYPGVDEPVPTAAVMNWVIGIADLPDEVVAGVVRLLTDERDALAQVHDMVNQIDMASLLEAPIALHPVTQAWVEANLYGGRVP